VRCVGVCGSKRATKRASLYLGLGAAEEEGAENRVELPDHHGFLLFRQVHLPQLCACVVCCVLLYVFVLAKAKSVRMPRVQGNT
jgi:hypothetical protein